MRRNYTDLVFENYDQFLQENQEQVRTPHDALEMLSTEGSFEAYMEALTDGLPQATKESVMSVARREREMLLEESINVGPSSNVIGYAVTYFPILTDIYADPVISQVTTTYPVNQSIMTIPRVRMHSKIKNTDGTTTTHRMPNAQTLVRGGTEDIQMTPNENHNLFSLSSGGMVNSDNARINQRYFMINEISVTSDAGSGNTQDHPIPLSIRPDARGQVKEQFTFTDVNGDEVEGTVLGSANYDEGSFYYSVNYVNQTTPSATTSYSTNHLSAKLMFSPRTGDIGRVKVNLEMSGWDVNIDVRDDFEIELETERIQDYRDIYNIDLVRTMSQAIKQQMMLNKDFDLSYFLNAYEPTMAQNGSASTVDLQTFATSGAGGFAPANVMDVFKGVIPSITSVSRIIHQNFRASPQFIIAGLKTASMLESLQDYVVNMPTNNMGEAGFQAGGGIDFRKMTILSCPAVEEDKIYVVYKAPSDRLDRTAIVDLIYKPLYIIEEVTDSQKRTYVKSRSALELTTPEALGVINVKNYNKYF